MKFPWTLLLLPLLPPAAIAAGMLMAWFFGHFWIPLLFLAGVGLWARRNKPLSSRPAPEPRDMRLYLAVLAAQGNKDAQYMCAVLRGEGQDWEE